MTGKRMGMGVGVGMGMGMGMRMNTFLLQPHPWI